ncbi:MAG: trypsin-like peptidase domain-containing protein [Planctomycetales bacterium]|nr:trypsin-like peptidase domain-containing protein [bacterium]UNM07369.1 MAG: trypsin-like peptidase domain-containing protein [Planctomycetales bacterium]
MRTVLFTVCVVVMLAGQALAQQDSALSVEDIVNTVKKGVVKVQGIDIGGPTSAGWGGGSGFLFEIDYDTGLGYAITNHHVSGSSSISAVTFWDGAAYKARLVATEPGIDIALLEVYDLPDESDLPDSEKTIIPVVLGDSDTVPIGALGMAMGAPGDFNDAINIDRSNPYDAGMLMQTVTTGEVSGRDWPIEFLLGINRQAQSDLGRQYGTNFDYAFKVSTPINPGNSGGPLFNNSGEVIGINFWGGSFQMAQNSNHAIPINLAKDFVFQVLEKGRFEKPWTGMDIIFPSWVSVDEYTEFTEKYRPDYIEIFNIRRDSPASRAGLRKGDIIVSVDGQQFTDPEKLRLYVFSQDIGNELELVVKRDNKIMKEPIFVEVGVKRTYDSEFSV